MRAVTSLVCGIAAVAFVAQADAAGTGVEKRYTLADQGVLQLKVPAGWQDRVKAPSKEMPVAIEFAQSEGRSFIVTLLPLWQTRSDRPLPGKAELRKRVEYAADGMLPFAAESAVKLVEIKGASGSGYYFSLTDNALKPGGYKFITQGALRVGALLIRFTILTNEGQEQIARDALEMLKGAAHLKR